MSDITPLIQDMAWSTTILLAWFVGELAHQILRLPRISVYSIVGFILGSAQLGVLPNSQSATILLLANIAFGFILFECGYRFNLGWLRTNPWLIATSLTETSLTFIAVYFLAMYFGQSTSTAMLLAALSMATSPAAIVRVINEQRSSGQVTERVLHLSALNCVIAVFTFKVVVGLVIFQTSGSLWDASYSSLVVLTISVLIGLIFGLLIPALLRLTKRTTYDSTLAFTIAIICLVTLAHSLKLSPVLATLTFGLVARHRRIVMNPSQRGFGALGDLLSVLLFVFIAATLDWEQVLSGMWLGFAILAVRQIAKTAGICLFAIPSGISLRKGVLVGMATTPISAFVILVLEQTRYLGINLVDQVAPLAAAAFILEVFGPVLIKQALRLADEIPEESEV